MSRQEKRMSGVFILLLLMFVFAILIALYFLMGYFNEQAEQKSENSSMIPEFAGIDLEAVDTFSYDYDGALQTFLKSGEDWIYAEDESITLNTAMVDSMLKVLENLQYEKVVADTLVTSSEYGFDQPEMTVTVSLSDGTQKILYIGSKNPMVQQYYAVAEGDDKIYTIDSQVLQAFLPVSDLTEEEDTSGEDTDGSTDTADTSGGSNADQSQDSAGTDSSDTGGNSGTASSSGNTDAD